MRVSVLIGLLLLLAACSRPPLKVHMLSGSSEYESEKSLQGWASHLKDEYGIEPTFSLGTDKSQAVDGLESLATADVLVVFCRRWELTGEQAEAIRSFIESGKPIVGIRTASHAFQFYQEFDRDVLGGSYSGHGEGGKTVEIGIVEDHRDHPVLEQVSGWSRLGKPYWNPEIAKDAKVLLTTEAEGKRTPLAWTRTLESGQRVFYTSLGIPIDFENERFVRLLDNALFWVAKEH